MAHPIALLTKQGLSTASCNSRHVVSPKGLYQLITSSEIWMTTTGINSSES